MNFKVSILRTLLCVNYTDSDIMKWGIFDEFKSQVIL